MCEWWDGIYYEFKETAKEKGFKVDDIYFTGFFSQGDGACFVGSVSDFTKFTEKIDRRVAKLIKDGKIELSCLIKHTGRYYHERSSTFDYCIDTEVGLNILSELEKIEDEIREIYYSACRTLYRELEEEYYALQNDENVRESIVANEYEFYSNGEVYHAK